MLSGFAYIGCTVLALFIFVLIKYFAGNFLPGEFGSLGRLKGCLGFFLRVFMYLLTLAHWLLIAPIAIFLLTYFTMSACFSAAMGLQSLVFLMVPVFWLLQHLGGAMARTFIDIPTFLIIPDSAEGSKAHLLFVTCGP